MGGDGREGRRGDPVERAALHGLEGSSQSPRRPSALTTVRDLDALLAHLGYDGKRATDGKWVNGDDQPRKRLSPAEC
jgi:hypothetical protein